MVVADKDVRMRTMDEHDIGHEVGSSASNDARDMSRFDKKQEFRRNFSMISVVGLSCTLMLTWEGTLALLLPLVLNGGPTGAFAGYIFVLFGVLCQTLVMAEMASMIPLSGGVYNWVAILAPPRYTSLLSYMTGWVSSIAWQGLSLSAAFLNATIIQALATLMYPEYEFQRWHGTLILFAVIFLAVIVNTLLGRLLPMFEATVLFAHVLGFFGIIFTICYLGPKNSSEVVFQTFINGGEWSTDGQSFLVGAVSSMFLFTGADAASHMAEEIENAAVVIPRSMIASVIINGLLGLGMLVAILFVMGDPGQVLSSTFFFPFITIFASIVNSASGAVGMTSIILIVTLSGSIGLVATSSRMLWAFAREGGVPGWRLISKVEPKSALPLWSIGVTALISILLSLINIGSTTAFNAFTGLTVAGFYSTFVIAASVMLHKRITTPASEMRWGPFRLYGAGIPLTVYAIMYSIVGWFFSFWPPTPAFDKTTFNWSAVVYGGTALLALLWWFISARKHYTGPRHVNSSI